jgi:hypothetical protein
LEVAHIRFAGALLLPMEAGIELQAQRDGRETPEPQCQEEKQTFHPRGGLPG